MQGFVGKTGKRIQVDIPLLDETSKAVGDLLSVYGYQPPAGLRWSMGHLKASEPQGAHPVLNEQC